MDKINITLKLPENLIQWARQSGLLTDEVLSAVVQQALEDRRQKRVDSFFEMVDRLSTIEPGLSEAEIQAEIQAYHEEKRGST